MNKLTIDSTITDIFSYTSILHNTLLFKSDALDEKFEELATLINKQAILEGKLDGISWLDIKYIYMNELDKIGIENLKGDAQQLEYGQANILSSSSKDRIRKILKKIISKNYTITLSVKNYKGTFNLGDQPFEGVTFEYDTTNNIFKISIITQGYFNFDEQNKDQALRYSAIDTAISILKIIFSYLSFFKNSIWVGDTFSYDQELQLSVQDNSDFSIKTIETYERDIILMLYPCHVKYQYREHDQKNINSKFLSLITNQKHLLLAFGWFTQSLHANDNDTRIIMLCIAFEALYGKHNTTKEQTKNKDTYILKAVFFLSVTNKERENFSAILLDLFNARNAIVHADIKKKSDIQNSRIFHKSKNIFIRASLKELTVY